MNDRDSVLDAKRPTAMDAGADSFDRQLDLTPSREERGSTHIVCRANSVFSFAILVVAMAGLSLPWAVRAFHKWPNAPDGLQFSETVYDFGHSFQNDELHRSVSLSNWLTVPVRIAEFKTSCHCAVVAPEIRSRTLSPGESVDIPVVIKTGEASGVLESRLAVAVHQVGDSANATMASCIVRAIVDPEFALSHDALDFGIVSPGNHIETRTITLTPVRGCNVNVLKTACTNARFSAEPFVGDNGKTAINVGFQSNDGDFEVHSGQLKILTDSTRKPETSIYLKAVIDVPIKPVPTSVLFVDGQTSRKQVKVKSSRRIPFQILAIESTTGEFVHATAVLNECSFEHTVDVQARKKAQAQQDGCLIIRYQIDDLQNVLRVPFHFFSNGD